ncbi:fibronectin type III domain-containing protein [Jatrophihabitans sp.]|uniref:fibronectin type III domain-containing protein n=1 Tax=Jatrophihabitans sp. TaxID=1932789 RepID=UPI002BBDA5E4|nr:fibronectin type III domain-containing protein [Jatrophihabitans sp.]
MRIGTSSRTPRWAGRFFPGAPTPREAVPTSRAARRLVTRRLVTRRTAVTGVVALVLGLLIPVAALAPTAAAIPGSNPIGVLDTVAVRGSDGTITISGWTADQDDPLDPLRVEIYDNGRYATAVIAQAPRPDVSVAIPAIGPNHGFTVSYAGKTGLHQVCALALNHVGGSNTQLGCRSVRVDNDPVGQLKVSTQQPGGFTVSGWAIDPNQPTAPVLIRTYLDGKYSSGRLATVARTDLPAQYAAGGPNHGFSFLLAMPAGSHQVCVYAMNIGAGSVNPRLGCSTVTLVDNPVGTLDNATQQPGGFLATGYALDLNTTSPITVRIYLDGHYVAGALASGTRSDLATRYPGYGQNHGYSIFTRVPAGTHQLCAYGLNVGAGTVNTRIGCRTVTMNSNPLGVLGSSPQQPGGFLATGYALDPDVTSPITVRIYLDGHWVASGLASVARSDVATRYPGFGQNHGFTIFTPATAGTHQLCAYAMNTGSGTVNTRFGCQTVTRTADPAGGGASIARVGVTDTVAISGWALDPDTASPVTVRITSDGVEKQLLTANQAATGMGTAWSRYGSNHGYSVNLVLDGFEHLVCATALNVGPGKDVSQGCQRITTSGSASPAAPTGLAAWPGSKQVTLNWTPSVATAAPVSSYEILVMPGNRTVSVAGTAVSAVVTGLVNGTTYTFTVRGINLYGRSSAASVRAVPTNVPPQTSPAPVSTSHYIRNLTGNASIDLPMMRRMGATDASYNPSGHSYLILLQIGGQDEYRKGVLLSAIAKYVSYPTVVAGMKAYLDGYVSAQKPYAPLTLAIGTNNDVDVNYSAGVSWARNVVNPVLSYAASKYPGVVIAGANDIEPGFSATVSESRAWVSGYLSATTSKYVFNGSADGCSTSVPNSRCNNGWTMADLQWLSGGAAPSRTINLPQIYNYAMPLQWKNISLTGTAAGKPRLYFGGPLTEVTACNQAGSCGSITNIDAWNRLWNAISSTAATKQSQMPHGTDLRIN